MPLVLGVQQTIDPALLQAPASPLLEGKITPSPKDMEQFDGRQEADDDLSKHEEESQSSHESVDSRVSSNPASIPLPPSPTVQPTDVAIPPPSQSTPAKTYLPNRRPKGWISSLHPHSPQRFASASVVEPSPRDNHPVFTPPRSTSAAPRPRPDGHIDLEQGGAIGEEGVAPRPRVTSVHKQRGWGRTRVSGVLQHALSIDQLEETHEDYPPFQNEDGGSNSVVGLNEEGNTSQLEYEQDEGVSFSSEGERGTRTEINTGQEEDEIWMAYVREQLGALFPDFFNVNPDSAQSHSSAELRSWSQEERIQAIPTVEDEEISFAATEDTLESELPPTPPRTAFGQPMQMQVQMPNVREEIGSLRDEIMRLRSVVGGLAEGLTSRPAVSTPAGSLEPAADAESEVGETNEVEARVDQDASGVSESGHGVTQAFINTADMSASIIRSLDRIVANRAKGDIKDDSDSDAEGRTDEQIFSRENLQGIMDFVESIA